MTCKRPTISPVKKGDTFTLVGTYKQDNVPADITSFDIRAQVRDARGALVDELVITKADQLTDIGVFTVSGGNIDWLPGEYQCDIEFSNGGTVRSTQTFFIPVVQDVTYG